MAQSKNQPTATPHETPELTDAVCSLRDHLQLVGNILDELRTQFVWATRNGRIVIERDGVGAAERLTAEVDEHQKRSVRAARSEQSVDAPHEPLSLAQPTVDDTHFTPTELLFPEALRQVPGLAEAIADIELQLGLTRRQAGMLLTALELLLQHAPDEIRDAIDRLAGAIGAQTRAIGPLEHAIGEFTTDFQWALRRMQDETGSIAGERDRTVEREEPRDAETDHVYCCPQPQLEWSGPHEHPTVACASCGYVVAEEGQLISYADAAKDGYRVTEEADELADTATHNAGATDDAPMPPAPSRTPVVADPETNIAATTDGAQPERLTATAAIETAESPPLRVVAVEGTSRWASEEYALWRSDGFFWCGLFGWLAPGKQSRSYLRTWPDLTKAHYAAETLFPDAHFAFDAKAPLLFLDPTDETPHENRSSPRGEHPRGR